MNKHLFLFTALLAAVLLGGCIRQSFDNPPDVSGYDPGVPAGNRLISINALKRMNGPYASSSVFDTTLIQDDIAIAGIVTADDRSGNYYKQIVVQDDSGNAIAVNIDAYSLFTNYPVGRKLYIKCRGLYLGYDGGIPVLGMAVNEQKGLIGLTGSAIGDHIIKANVGNAVKDTVVTFDFLKGVTDPYSPFINRLVTIKDSVEFQTLGVTYTDPSTTTNRNITLCASATPVKTMVVRTSNYANFHAVPLPTGRGIIRGIFTIYKSTGTTAQLLVRDTNDVRFYGTRCGGASGTTATLFSEDFSSGTANADIALTGWTNYAEVGGQKFKFSNAGSTTNMYAKITAFGTNQAPVTSWLVTPGINLTNAAIPMLTFKSADGYDNGATLKVLMSTNFNGSNFSTATWTSLSPALAPLQASGYSSFTTSGNVPLTAGSTVYIAFKYEGTDPSGTGSDKTTTWELDDVKVTAQ